MSLSRQPSAQESIVHQMKRDDSYGQEAAAKMATLAVVHLFLILVSRLFSGGPHALQLVVAPQVVASYVWRREHL